MIRSKFLKIFCDKLTVVWTISISFTCKIATDSAKIGAYVIKSLFFIGFSNVIVHRWKAKILLFTKVCSTWKSGEQFKEIASLTTQSWHKFGKKRDINFSV